MQKSKKGLTRIFWLISGIGFVFVLFTAYFVFVKNNKFNFVLNKNSKSNMSQSYTKSVEERLVEAQIKVESETRVLEDLVMRSKLEKEKTAELKGQYVIVNGLLEKKTDSLFTNPKSSNPQIRIALTDKVVEKNINTARKDVQQSLNAWKAKFDEYTAVTSQKSNTQVTSISLADILITSQKSVVTISEYINQLKSLINNLTIENSNLTQAQIDNYKVVINDAIKELEKAKSQIIFENLENEKVDQKPVVTPVQIKNQEVIVEQVKNDVSKIEDEISSEVETDIQVEDSSDTTPPAVLITSPKPGTDLSYGVLVSASANDAGGISKIEFYDNSSLIGTDTTMPYSIIWSTTTASDGPHTLTAKAYDNSGNIKSSVGISVTVSNSENPMDNINVFEDPELIEGANSID